MGAKKNEGSRDKHMSDISACSPRMRGKRAAIKEYDGPHGGHRAARPPRVKKILKVAIWESPGFLAILWIEGNTKPPTRCTPAAIHVPFRLELDTICEELCGSGVVGLNKCDYNTAGSAT